MEWYPIKKFDSKTMGFKLTVVFISVILVPMFLLAYVSYRVIDSGLIKEAEDRINIGLRAAWTEYYVRGDQMRYGMLQAASMEEIQSAVRRSDRAYLKEMMIRWKQMRPYVDIWAVIDKEGRVVSRLNSAYTGDLMDLGGLVPLAFSSGEPIISTEMLSGETLSLEGSGLGESINTTKKDLAPASSGTADTMAVMVITPVLDEGHNVLGAIVTGDILNNDTHISDTVAFKIPGLFTTISIKGERVTTNLIDNNGVNLRLTRLPGNILSGVNSGKQVFSEWSVAGLSFISIFEPIRDHNGRIIGSLDVGVSKEKIWSIQKENQNAIILITLIGLTVSLIAAAVSTVRITRPIKSLKEKISAYAEGDMSARVEVEDGPGVKDEIKTLAHSFNKMMAVVSRREEEKERYLKEIEERSRELALLNRELKKTNEELEVAYEETQSQTEELHAINEELKLLNEDLDRKNIELKKANLIITLEEEELKRAKDKLRLIYDSIRDYIILVDSDLKVIEANRQLLERTNLTEQLAAGRSVYGLFGIYGAVEDCPIRNSIEKKEPFELEIVSSDGSVYMWHSFPLQDEISDSRRAVVYVKDVTDQKLLMNRVMQSDKLSSLRELVSGVAHELNNPLTGIMCFSELLLQEEFKDGVKVKLARINDASHRCKKIIDNLLTFARWKRPERKYGDINSVIRESADLRSYQLKLDNIDLILDLDESLPRTMFDEDQMHQVLSNLLNNSRDAILEKGEKGKIIIRSSRADGKIAIRIEDTGKGMPAEVANRIFDPFFTTKDVGKGTGLGLSISYGIINEHGGSIYPKSLPGVGTTFVIELPVTGDAGWAEDDEKDAVSALRDGLASFPEKIRALVLDDEPMILDMLNEFLSSVGFEVDKTESGEEALGKVTAADYGVIISDIKMPGIGGRGFYEEVRRIKPGAASRIIFISGDSINTETQDFLRQSGNLSLRKPFSVNELAETVSKLVL